MCASKNIKDSSSGDLQSQIDGATALKLKQMIHKTKELRSIEADENTDDDSDDDSDQRR